MKNIVLLCAAGMSTSLLVTKMKNAAAAEGFECDINAYAISEAPRVVPDSDLVLLGPQVRFNLTKLREQFPEKIIDSIDMRAYGMMDGKAVIKFSKEKMGC